jgi:hypothetical protein
MESFSWMTMNLEDVEEEQQQMAGGLYSLSQRIKSFA